jgi:predicted ATPase
MATETALIQSRLEEIGEISNVLNECDKVIEDLSQRLHWDTEQLLSVSICKIFGNITLRSALTQGIVVAGICTRKYTYVRTY